ncbi:MAG: hypothetical protein UT63_C0016G0009 [Candidatus Gottesmanbacteria bacterium GW2011_GWC2_39_8]|uniref:Uncharacterized protein n=1 Tax=Candidatus Gottesmanbacteria bacterium GW2011_GWC2_39_8 TaxID=1618450 RepID=A0A0G0SFI3_9BACT|nr:MAG: hypothetical protein UT63_C0016G0009 [Candidatus Gottesmanbacteria bacterium GW2011_GWC2_39_8]
MIPKYLDFLTKPAEQEYFTKFNAIYSRNQNGNAVAVNLQNVSSPTNLQGKITLYCDKILVGETLEIALRRALQDNFGLKLFDFDLMSYGIDVANNKRGESVTRFPVVAYVEYGKLKNKNVVGCNTSWLDRRKYFLNEGRPEALGWLKDNQSISLLGKNKTVKKEDILSFVEDLYQKGALDIKFGELEREQEPDYTNEKLNPDFIEVRLPKNMETRKTLFEIINSGFDSKSAKKIKDSDTGQTTLCYYWS